MSASFVLTFLPIFYTIYMLFKFKRLQEEPLLNIKQSYTFFFFATVATVALRTAMLFFTIDPQSGFINESYSALAYSILAIIFIAALMLFGFAYFFGKKEFSEGSFGIVYKATAIAMSFVILFDSFASTSTFATFPWQKYLEIISAIVAAIYLTTSALSDVLSFKTPEILSVAPIVFWFVRLIIIFTSFSTLANISDNIFELAALCLLLLSSLNIAKLVCLPQSEKFTSFSFALFLTTALVCFVNSLPRAILIIGKNTEFLHKNDLPVMTTLMAGFYILLFAVNSFKDKKDA